MHTAQFLPKRAARGARGVSLLELMIVVAILGIATALAVPNLMPTIAGHRLYAQNLAVSGFVDQARRRAVAEGRCVRIRKVGISLFAEKRASSDCVNFDRDTAWTTMGQLTQENGNVFSLTFNTDMTISHALTAPPGPFLAGETAADFAIVFRPNGRLYGDGDLDFGDDGARILLTHLQAKERRAVVVTPAGRICARNYGIVTNIPQVDAAGALGCP